MIRRYKADLYERIDDDEDYIPRMRIIAVDNAKKIILIGNGSFEKKSCGDSGLDALLSGIKTEVEKNTAKSYRLEIEIEEENGE